VLTFPLTVQWLTASARTTLRIVRIVVALELPL
jgi:hypothetical protein